MEFDGKQKFMKLSDTVVIEQENNIMKADKVDLYGEKLDDIDKINDYDTAICDGNVEMIDKKKKGSRDILYGGHVEYYKLVEYAIITINPRLDVRSETMIVYSDSMVHYYNSDTSIAHGNVRIIREHDTGVCGLAIYDNDAKIGWMYKYPALYSNKDIVRGDTMIFYDKEKRYVVQGHVWAELYPKEEAETEAIEDTGAKNVADNNDAEKNGVTALKQDGENADSGIPKAKNSKEEVVENKNVMDGK